MPNPYPVLYRPRDGLRGRPTRDLGPLAVLAEPAGRAGPWTPAGVGPGRRAVSSPSRDGAVIGVDAVGRPCARPVSGPRRPESRTG